MSLKEGEFFANLEITKGEEYSPDKFNDDNWRKLQFILRHGMLEIYNNCNDYFDYEEFDEVFIRYNKISIKETVEEERVKYPDDKGFSSRTFVTMYFDKLFKFNIMRNKHKDISNSCICTKRRWMKCKLDGKLKPSSTKQGTKRKDNLSMELCPPPKKMREYKKPTNDYIPKHFEARSLARWRLSNTNDYYSCNRCLR